MRQFGTAFISKRWLDNFFEFREKYLLKMLVSYSMDANSLVPIMVKS